MLDISKKYEQIFYLSLVIVDKQYFSEIKM